jgi:Protein of unknown function (DUF2934)
MSISISSHQRIRHRAQEIFEERAATGRKGDALSDWLEAEQEIRRRRSPAQMLALDRHPTPSEFPLNVAGFRPDPPSPRPRPESICRSA